MINFPFSHITINNMISTTIAPLNVSIQLDLARKLEKIAAEKGVQLFLASDVVLADKFAPDAAVQVRLYSWSISIQSNLK